MSKCLAVKYMEKNPNIKIMLEGGGSDLTISDGIFGKVDIIQSSEPMSVSDKNYLANLKKLVYEHEIAMEVLTVFVHPENPVNELSIYQLQSIFSGKVNSWKDFGGKDVEIEVYTIPNVTLTGLSFNKFVMKDKAFSHKAKFFETSDEVKIAVEKNPYSIGFGSFQRINIGKNSLKFISIKKEDIDQAYPPSDKFIKVLLYPLCRYYYYYTIEDPDEQTKKYIE